jgi:predicted transcriptional regulator
VLAAKHGVTVREVPTLAGLRRLYDPQTRELALPAETTPARRAFQMATQLATLEYAETIDRLVAADPDLNPAARPLTRIGLAHYFAGALILPYRDFLASAEACRYDIDALCRAYHVGFETVCHRLSTLQRPRARGVPFFFVRTDRAGNISKRQSASTFHFSRTGGSCPLWVVHEAFDNPGRIRRQVAQLPDGRTYLWITRTVSARPTSFRDRTAQFAIGLGCDIRHAHRLVYSDGLDLADQRAITPIGPGCRTCERTDCAQRAFPIISRAPIADPHTTSAIPYR